MAKKVYEIVNEKIADLLAKGTVPWHKPWRPRTYQIGGEAITLDVPRNLCSKKAYRGINVFLLLAQGYDSPWWLTYKQAQAMGGNVRQGEKGSMVVYWNFVHKTVEGKDGKDVDKAIPFLKYYTVFNVEQCDLPEGKVPVEVKPEPPKTPEAIEEKREEEIAAAEAVVAGYKNGPRINLNGNDRACYSFVIDEVTVPTKPQFEKIGEYYSTLFHELGHSTGHEKRLARTFGRSFGDKDYAREELTAEMTAAYLCGHAGIEGTFDNSAAYLANWQQSLKDDQYLFIVAAGKAQAAADLILGTKNAEGIDQEE